MPFRRVPLGGGSGGEMVFVELSELSVSEREGGGESCGMSNAGGDDFEVAIILDMFVAVVFCCEFDCALLTGGGGAFRPELDLLSEPLIAGRDSAVLLVESFLDSGGEGGSGFFCADGDTAFADVGDLSSIEGEGKGGCCFSKRSTGNEMGGGGGCELGVGIAGGKAYWADDEGEPEYGDSEELLRGRGGVGLASVVTAVAAEEAALPVLAAKVFCA